MSLTHRTALFAAMACLIACGGSDDEERAEVVGSDASVDAPDAGAPPLDTDAPDDDVETSQDSEENDGADHGPTVEDTSEPPPPPGWEALPLGAQGDLHSIRFLAEQGFRVVGDGGTILRPLGTGWVREWVPNWIGSLRDVISGPDGLHAVGDGGTWLTLEPSGTWVSLPGPDVDLSGLARLGDTVFAVGDEGTIIGRSPGSAMAWESNELDVDLLAIAASPPDAEGETTVFAVGTGGAVLRRVVIDEEPGFDWFADKGAGAAETLRAAWALDTNNVWAVGDSGAIHHYTGGWSTESAGDGESRDLYAIGGGAGLVMAAGASGAFLSRHADEGWSKVTDVQGPLFTAHRFEGIAIGGDRIVAAGADGAMQIKQLPNGPFVDAEAHPSSALRAIASLGIAAIAVGDDGLVVKLHPDGHGALANATSETLHAVTWSTDGVWIAGDAGTLLTTGDIGAPLETVSTGVSASLRGVVALPDGGVLSVGEKGTALRVTAGGEVVQEQSGTAFDLSALFLAGETPTAVGEAGTILVRADGGWTPLPTPAVADLYAGAHAGGRSVVVGAHGTVLYWDEGSAPAVLATDPLAVYYGVAVNDGGAAWIVGFGGAVHKLGADGSLEEVPSPTPLTLRGVAAADGKLIVGGDRGALHEWVGGLPQ